MKSLRTLFATIGLGLLAVPAMAQSLSFDDTNFRKFLNEFDRYAAADWTLTTTEAGAGAATEALTSIDGGAILITNDNADNDNDFFQLPSEGFKWESSKPLYFKTRFKVSDATQSDIVIGLQITDTSPLDVSDGIFFLKPDDAASLFFRVEKNDTVTSDAATAIATLADDTFVTLAFYYEPSDGKVQYWVNGVMVGARAITNVPDDEELTVSFGLQNGAAAAKTMTLDYVFVAKGR
jgi:hypothetical protein